MKTHPIPIHHSAFTDIPEEILLMFLMIWDLSEDHASLEKELATLADKMADRLPLFEVPSREDLMIFDEDVPDLTALMKKDYVQKGNRFIPRSRLNPKTNKGKK